MDVDRIGTGRVRIAPGVHGCVWGKTVHYEGRGVLSCIFLAPQLVCGCSTRAPWAFFLAWGGAVRGRGCMHRCLWCGLLSRVCTFRAQQVGGWARQVRYEVAKKLEHDGLYFPVLNVRESVPRCANPQHECCGCYAQITPNPVGTAEVLNASKEVPTAAPDAAKFNKLSAAEVDADLSPLPVQDLQPTAEPAPETSRVASVKGWQKAREVCRM